MQNTSNYNLNLVEGTDLVNPPIQFNPNFQTIDAAMFANKEKTVGTASEVVTGTVHAIVRANQDADTFRFTATGAWTTGDTMTVDGTSVTVHLSDGTAPLTGAYVIGAEVLAVLNGTLVTLITSSAAIDPGVTSFNSRTGAVTPASSDYDASMIDYDNTLSGLTSTDVQGAIDELSNGTGSRLIYSTTQTNVSFGTLLVELKPYFDQLTADEKANSYLVRGNSVYTCSSTIGIFVNNSTYTNNISNSSYRLNDQTCFESGINGAGVVTITNTTANLTSETLHLYVR